MANARLVQLVHINQMFLAGALSRAQFEEVCRLAREGQFTREIADQISQGKYHFFQHKLSDVHHHKVWTVWKRLGEKVLGVPFDRYLKGTDGLEAIPMLPLWPPIHSHHFNREVLVDGRIVAHIGLSETCNLLSIAYKKDAIFDPYELAWAKTGVWWMHANGGYRRRNLSPAFCYTCFQNFEVGMAANEGVFTYLDDPKIFEENNLYLLGSVRHGSNGDVACLSAVDGKPTISWCVGDRRDPSFGSASRAV